MNGGTLEEAFAHARSMYEMARDDQLGVESDEEGELLSRAQDAAMDALFLAHAPDLAALAFKMEVFAAEDCFGLCGHIRDSLFAALIADVRRLGGLQ